MVKLASKLVALVVTSDMVTGWFASESSLLRSLTLAKMVAFCLLNRMIKGPVLGVLGFDPYPAIRQSSWRKIFFSACIMAVVLDATWPSEGVNSR